MPHIIPIKDLKNTSEISELCHKTDEPIYITKNGQIKDAKTALAGMYI